LEARRRGEDVAQRQRLPAPPVRGEDAVVVAAGGSNRIGRHDRDRIEDAQVDVLHGALTLEPALARLRASACIAADEDRLRADGVREPQRLRDGIAAPDDEIAASLAE